MPEPTDPHSAFTAALPKGVLSPAVRCHRLSWGLVPLSSQPAEAAEAFYSRALPRIRRFMLGLAPALAILVLLRFGWKVGMGFVAGCVIAYLNFYWLKRAVNAFADRVTATGERPSGAMIMLRFFGRYLLMAFGAYAIFTVSPASLYGLFAGLFLPVAAIMCEAGYELYAALRHGL